eukprot:gnl/MRDRNA2_/MRDRNA2_80195_c0_seq1.p1 gnl/MRDRNA2_/MRDRNA2_80195_c0~~gnl/MRDRNA2_/MRDRNA2_80195_c0_seq1.p1  ORF type:complete len:336 (+),score=76.40 gnl/MRDRNA2_/MRDRNA2_80195_c0_seq1:75-1082(+)
MGFMRKKLRFGGTAWLRELKCFAGFEDDDLIEKMLAVAHVQRVPEGGIVTQDGVADALRIIVEGSVEVIFDDDVEPTVLVDGEYFGFSSALGTSIHAEASEARALSPVVIHVLHDEDVQLIVNQRTRCAWPVVEKAVSGRPCTPCAPQAQLSMVGGLLQARLQTPWQPTENQIGESNHLLGEETMNSPADDKPDKPPVFDAWSWGWGDPSEAWGTPRFPDQEEAKATKKSGNKQRKARRPRQLCDVPALPENLREDLENIPGDCTWPVLFGSPNKLTSTSPASPQTARDESFFQPASARYPMSPAKSPWESPMKTPHRGLMSPAKMPHRRRRACA